MSQVAYQAPLGHAGFSTKGPVSVFTKLTAWFEKRSHLRRMERHLSTLDDRLLNDIGLERRGHPFRRLARQKAALTHRDRTQRDRTRVDQPICLERRSNAMP